MSTEGHLGIQNIFSYYEPINMSTYPRLAWCAALATALAVAASAGFVALAASHRECPLIYDKVNGDVTEAQMRAWAADAGWTITSPTWSDEVGSCVCDADPDPALASRTQKTPVWIAPCDLASLYPGMQGKWPVGFRKVLENGGCLPKDHVKVCLERSKLDQLWNGLNAMGAPGGLKHCHAVEPAFEVFAGWDGDLYCKHVVWLGDR